MVALRLKREREVLPAGVTGEQRSSERHRSDGLAEGRRLGLRADVGELKPFQVSEGED